MQDAFSKTPGRMWGPNNDTFGGTEEAIKVRACEHVHAGVRTDGRACVRV